MNNGVWWGNLKERDCFEELGILGSVTPKWILKELLVSLGNCFI